MLNNCPHSIQDHYIIKATGEHGCDECDEAAEKRHALCDTCAFRLHCRKYLVWSTRGGRSGATTTCADYRVKDISRYPAKDLRNTRTGG